MDTADLNKDLAIAYTALQVLYALGQDVAPAIKALFQLIILKQPLSDDERAALVANHTALTQGLQRPIDDNA